MNRKKKENKVIYHKLKNYLLLVENCSEIQ